MIEQLIEKLILEGKVKREDIDIMVEELKAKQPKTVEEVDDLKKRQDTSEDAILMLMDMTLGGF